MESQIPNTQWWCEAKKVKVARSHDAEKHKKVIPKNVGEIFSRTKEDERVKIMEMSNIHCQKVDFLTDSCFRISSKGKVLLS
jgi:hypothetical protein